MLVRLLNSQITQLCIDRAGITDKSTNRHKFEVFAIILSVSKQLCDLTLSSYDLKNVSKSNLWKMNCTSSTLTKLNISVYSVDECLYLLDGRFECLSTLIVEIQAITDSLSHRENKVSDQGSISRFKEVCLKNLLIVFFRIEKSSSTKMFLVIHGCDDISLRRTNCSTPSSNVKSRRINIISYGVPIRLDLY